MEHGAASEYDLRYGVSEFRASGFEACTRDTSVAAPQEPGTPESHLLDVGEFCLSSFIALKVADEIPNWSAVSDIIEVPTDLLGFVYTYLPDDETCVAAYRPRWEFYKGSDIRGVKISFSPNRGFPLRPVTRPDGQVEKTLRFPIGAMYNRWQPDRGPWKRIKQTVLSDGTLYWRLEGASRSLGTIYGPTRCVHFETGEVTGLTVSPSHDVSTETAVWPTTENPPTFSWTDATEWMRYFYVDVSTQELSLIHI